MNIIVLLAGGIGSRMHATVPKQHISIGNHQLIEYTLMAFSKSELVDAILVVSNRDYVDQIKEIQSEFPKLKWIIEGGTTRILSVYNAVFFLRKICKSNDKIVFSDAARPCVRIKEIQNVLETLDKYKVVTTGVTVYETILKTKDSEILEIIPREGVLRQTSPEGYIFDVLNLLYLQRDLKCIEQYVNIGLEQSKEYGIKIGIVETSPLNFKITTQEDLCLFETVLRQGFEQFILS